MSIPGTNRIETIIHIKPVPIMPKSLKKVVGTAGIPDPDDGAEARVGNDGLRELSGSQFIEAVGADG